jgi:hypothetical protein
VKRRGTTVHNLEGNPVNTIKEGNSGASTLIPKYGDCQVSTGPDENQTPDEVANTSQWNLDGQR